jgi:CubicO group peptidase (beta-lactamase class C family)
LLSICRRQQESDKGTMMKRRDLLRTLGAVGAVTAVGRLHDSAAAGGQSFSAVSGRSTADSLATRLAASIQKHRVPGASAAVFRSGQWEVAAAGVTNVTTGVAVTPETVMHIGSITKVLNATLVMQLVDEGRVDLTAPLKRYLADFQVADRDATELITVEMLLNHTCGIDGEYFPDAGPDAQRIEDVIPRIARQGQIHAPGAELSYCNSGAVLAAYLAQRLLGKSWYTLIEERIFKPLESPAFSGAGGGCVAPSRRGWPFSQQGRDEHPNLVRVSAELRASRRDGHAHGERSRDLRVGPRERWSRRQRASSTVGSQCSANAAADGRVARRRRWGLRPWLDDHGQGNYCP